MIPTHLDALWSAVDTARVALTQLVSVKGRAHLCHSLHARFMTPCSCVRSGHFGTNCSDGECNHNSCVLCTSQPVFFPSQLVHMIPTACPVAVSACPVVLV